MFFPEGADPDLAMSGPGGYAQVLRRALGSGPEHLGSAPLSGHCFVFVNRRATQIRVLYWDRTGYSLWAKRLERGRFWDWRKPPASELDWTHLKLLLEGIEAGRQRRRYHRQVSENLAEITR